MTELSDYETGLIAAAEEGYDLELYLKERERGSDHDYAMGCCCRDKVWKDHLKSIEEWTWGRYARQLQRENE